MTRNNNSSKRTKWKLQFSLRTWLVLLTVLTIWFAWMLNRANRQKQVVSWVRGHGGKVWYDYQFDSQGKMVADPKLKAPKLAVDVLGVDFFSTLRWVYLDKSDAPSLTMLADAKHLRHLEFSEGSFDSIAPLADLTSLEHLSLSHNQKLHDLSPIRNLVNLKRLMVFDSQVDDVSPIANCVNLERLHLSQTEVDDIEPLGRCKQLQYLNLYKCPISKLDGLGTCIKLTRLDAGRTQITDISPLSALVNLEELRLNSCQIKDLSPLFELAALRQLHLQGNNEITIEQIKELQAKLPNCKIKHSIR